MADDDWFDWWETLPWWVRYPTAFAFFGMSILAFVYGVGGKAAALPAIIGIAMLVVGGKDE
ncbi:MAG: hypothetical protein KDA88_15985 [Planctomycetaceae bacterium]|nr:hypothetical protein [Planctomycetaceae bacterium]MCA9032398.1 hypothetical protein [Planctomycetaceae bacterium]